MSLTKTAGGNPLGTESINKLIVKFSVPAIISMLVNAIYNMVDQVFIGHGIGMVGIAATNIAFPVTTICTAAALLIGIGGASNFNLRMGEDKKEDASYFAGNMLSLMVLVGVGICALVLVFLRPMLTAFGATDTVMELALPYTAIIAPGVPFLIFATGATKLIQADGSPNYAMGCMVSGAVFNLIFDPIFLFVFDMGIEGIALATTLGQILSAALAFAYMLRRFHTVPLKRKHFAIKSKYATAIMALGMASCFNQLAITIVQITLNNVLRYYGALSPYGAEIPLAAVGAISKINFIYMSFTIGISQGCQPILGFNYGARHYERAKKAFVNGAIAATLISIAFTFIFQLFPAQLMAIFGENEALYLEFSVKYMRGFLLMTFLNGIQPVTASFFTSIGKARQGLLISLTRQILFLLPLILILPLMFGIDGVTYSGPISDFTSAIVSVLLALREIRNMNALQAQQNARLQEA